MSWTHIQGTGAQATSGVQTTLSATFANAVNAGDLIVVSAAFYWSTGGTPSVKDNVNNTAYTFKGPTYVNASLNLGTWYYVTPLGATAGTFTVTLTAGGVGYMAMAIDEFNYGTSAYAVDSSHQTHQTPATSIALGSSLAVTGIDVIYGAVAVNGSAGTFTQGSGFTLAYNVNMINAISYGIVLEYQLNQTSVVTPSLTSTVANLASINGIAFLGATLAPAILLGF